MVNWLVPCFSWMKNANRCTAGRSPMPHYSGQTCAFCGTRLDVHQVARGGVCAHPVCRKKHLLAQVERRRWEEVDVVRRVAETFRDRVAPALGVANPRSLTLGIVPHFDRPLVKLPRSCRQEFRAHLLRVVRQAFTETLTAAGVADLASELARAVTPPPHFPEGGAACATCQGFCCRNGAGHAYLDAAVIRSYLARHPGLGWRAVVRAYLRKIPVASFADSCVYQGRRGCVLPREMRSATCNHWYCDGLRELRATLDAGAPRPVLIVAVKDREVRSYTMIPPGGTGPV